MLAISIIVLLLIVAIVFLASVWHRPNPNYALVFDLLRLLPDEEPEEADQFPILQ